MLNLSLLASLLGSLYSFFVYAGNASPEWLIAAICIGSWFFINLLFWLLLIVVTAGIDTSKPRTTPSPFYYLLIQLGYWWLLHTGWIRYTCTGFDTIPQDRKCLVVCNHGSNFDNFIISLGMTRHNKIVFISKPENLNIFIAGGLMTKCAYIPIVRGNPRLALQGILSAIKVIEGNIAHVGVFPEGTRSKNGKIGPFKPGTFKIATKTDCPVVVVGIKNNYAIRGRAPWLPTKVECRVLEVISPEDRSTIELAEYCQARIAQYLTA